MSKVIIDKRRSKNLSLVLIAVVAIASSCLPQDKPLDWPPPPMQGDPNKPECGYDLAPSQDDGSLENPCTEGTSIFTEIVENEWIYEDPTEVHNFETSSDGRICVRVLNGDADGNHNVWWGKVFIDGEQIIGRSRLNRSAYEVSETLDLAQGVHELSVTTYGPRDAFVSVEISFSSAEETPEPKAADDCLNILQGESQANVSRTLAAGAVGEMAYAEDTVAQRQDVVDALGTAMLIDRSYVVKATAAKALGLTRNDSALTYLNLWVSNDGPLYPPKPQDLISEEYILWKAAASLPGFQVIKSIIRIAGEDYEVGNPGDLASLREKYIERLLHFIDSTAGQGGAP